MRAEDCSRKQEGFILVVVALVLVALVGFVALGVDVGVLFSARAAAQAAADSAALAGAFTFISQPSAAQPGTAETHALEIALNHEVFGVPIAAGDVSVNVDIPNRRVTVDLVSTQNTYFATILGKTDAGIAVRAIAEAAEQSVGAGPCKVKPWFVSNTILSDEPLACDACSAGEVLTVNGNATDWALDQLGEQFSVKPQNPSGAIGPGNFYAIQLPGSSGGDDYRDAIANDCFENPVIIQCQDRYSVETGNMVGPTKQGVNLLIGNPPVDLFHDVGVYGPAAGPYSDLSKNLVLAPIWDTCNAGYCPAGEFGHGSTVTLEIVGFAMFFLEGIQGDDVVARLINVSSCAPNTPGGGSSGETGGNVLSIPLRLVRLP